MPLVVASDREKAERDALTYASWGPPLTPEGYALREQRLRAHPFARAAMTSWLWKGDGGEVLASCETFRMESAWDGRAGHTYGVASVFTEPRLRGGGHATAMMQALTGRLPALDPLAQASILFSDVGAPIYRRAGYREHPLPYRVLAPSPGDPAAEVDALVHDDGVAAALDGAPWPRASFRVKPTAAQLDWHVERERIFAERLGVPLAPARGARAGRGLVLWYANRRERRLDVLLVLADHADETAALLGAARRVAGAVGLPEVVAWESPADPPWPEGPEGGAQRARAGSLPMIAPLAEGLAPEAWTWIPRALWI